MIPPLQLHVVTHTHWDREWYHVAQRFRQRLVALVDELLDAPPADDESFLLDGQAVLLDDYLAVRPERAGELSALLRDGRLEAGPWYVLPDELIPGGEALIRNLLLGRATVRRLRGEPPPVLYCPDSFGHPAALPDLARGFGCRVVILWRGYGGARWPAGDTVRWRGAGRAEVLLHHLPRAGYEFGSALPAGVDEARVRWERIHHELAPRAITGHALLLNGADHHARQRDHREAIAALASAASPDSVEHATLGEFARALSDAATTARLPLVEGELRDSYGYTWTLQGTLGTRASQKRDNAMLERSLVHDVEPWVALLDGAGSGAARASLRAAWRSLLLAHPHDTLCGTSIDAVADAFDATVASVAAQAAGLREDAGLALLGHDRERARRNRTDWRPAVLLRNPVARPRSGVAALTLVDTLASIAVGPGSANRQGSNRDAPPRIVDGIQRLDRATRVAFTESPRDYPAADQVLETRALGWVHAIGGYVIETRAPAFDALPHDVGPVRAGISWLDNGLVRVELSATGAIRLHDYRTGRIVEDAIDFEDHRDAGDLYTPAVRERLAGPRYTGCTVAHEGPLRGELSLEFERPISGGGATGGSIGLRLQLDAGVAALRVVVTGINVEHDHRLRMIVRTDVGRGAATIADAAFHPAARTPLVVSEDDARMERVVVTAPLHRWVSRYGPDRGVTLVSDGLAEYESLGDGGLAVTLVRAVGELSRHDLPERPGHAGWPSATPGAQCLGGYEATFAIALHDGDSPAQRDAVQQLADDVLLPITGETLRSNLSDSQCRGGIELRGAGLVFSAAAPAQQQGWIVLRCINRRAEAVSGSWTMGVMLEEARRARLDETPGDLLAIHAGMIEFVAAPMEIVTIVARVGGR